MAKQRIALIAGFFFLASVSTFAWAESSQEEINRLGADLTPLGAEKSRKC